MFSALRNERGRSSLLMAGIACLALAAALALTALPGTVRLLLSLGFGVAGVGCIGVWWSRRRADRYDLSRLWEEPPPSGDRPYEDTVAHGDEAAPYCGWCDAAYAPGTYRCPTCNRELG